MADQDIFHTAEIIKAALPFVDERSRIMADTFVKVMDLMGSVKTVRSSGNMAACGFDNGKIDLEGLLNGIRPVCSIKEREVVDRFLGFFNMKKMFEMYNNMMEMMKTMQEFSGFTNSSGEDTQNTTSNFSGFNFESIFGDMYKNQTSDTSFFTANETVEAAEEAPTYKEETPVHNEDSDTSSSFTNSNKTNNNSNDMMFDMLKGMVPPDKLSTIENLSMLFKTMSYDNNSKAVDSEESKNG